MMLSSVKNTQGQVIRPHRTLYWEAANIEGGNGWCYLYWDGLVVHLEAIRDGKDTWITVDPDGEESPTRTFVAGMTMSGNDVLSLADIAPLIPAIQNALDHFRIPLEIV